MPAVAAAQTHFEFLVPITKELMRVDEVMDMLRKEKDAVYALVDDGKLEAHQPDGRSAHYRITRRSVIAYIAATALYEPDDFVATLLNLAQRLTPAQRTTLLKKLQTLN